MCIAGIPGLSADDFISITTALKQLGVVEATLQGKPGTVEAKPLSKPVAAESKPQNKRVAAEALLQEEKSVAAEAKPQDEQAAVEAKPQGKPDAVAEAKSWSRSKSSCAVEAAKPKGKQAAVEVKLQGKLGTVCRKTRMCKFYGLGKCTKGSACNFAHDEAELKARPDLARTKVCPAFASAGHCGNPRCHFAHGREELRRVRLPFQQQSNEGAPHEAHQPQPQSSTRSALSTPTPSRQTTGSLETCSLPFELESLSQDSSPLSAGSFVEQLYAGFAVAGDVSAATGAATNTARLQADLRVDAADCVKAPARTARYQKADLRVDAADCVKAPARTARYQKTKMCSFYGIGHCLKGEDCNFAHSPEELKPNTRAARAYAKMDQQPTLQRACSDEEQSGQPQPELRRVSSTQDPHATRSPAEELQPTFARVSSLPSTTAVYGTPSPLAPMADAELAAARSAQMPVGVQVMPAGNGAWSVPVPQAAVATVRPAQMPMGVQVMPAGNGGPALPAPMAKAVWAAAMPTQVPMAMQVMTVSNGPPAPPAPVSQVPMAMQMMPAGNSAPAPRQGVVAAEMPAQLPLAVQVIVAAPAPAPLPPSVPTLLPMCTVSKQSCMDPWQLPEFPQSPWAETPQGAVARSDPFCMASVAANAEEALGLPPRPMTRASSEQSHWEPDEWSDSEIGDF